MNIASDTKRNRIITSEIYPGRMQVFRYITDAEAEQLRKEREQKRADSRTKPSESTAPVAESKPPQTK